MSERFPSLKLEDMDSRQREMAGYVLATRGSLRGFEMLLRSPELGDRMQRVGEYIRFKNTVPRILVEIAILLVAKKLKSKFEWYEHERISAEIGLDPKIAQAIGRGERPTLTEDQAIVYDFANEALETVNISDETYKRVVDRFGEIGLVDLTCTIGYYCAYAFILNIGRYQLPPGVSSPIA